jgi:hypothetical protein
MESSTKLGITATTAVGLITTTLILAMNGQVMGVNTLVRVDIPVGIHYVDDLILVSIHCSPTQPVKGFEFKITYDKNILNAISVSEGDMFTGFNTFFNSGVIDNTNGEIRQIYGLTLGPGNMTTNPNEFVIITFKAVSYGTSYINLNNVGVVNTTSYIPITITNNTLFITSNYDMNNDGIVNILDLNDLASHYGEVGAPGWIKEDINHDGMVRILDFVLVATHWGLYA